MTALTAEQLKQRKRYPCPACAKGYDTLAEKKRHIRATHPKKEKRRG